MGLTRVLLGLFCVLLFIVAPRVIAQTTVTLNENGTATAVTAGPGGGTVNCTGVNEQDPGPGGLPDALVFNVGTGPLLAAGDVLLYDPTTMALTDLIRFNDINGVDQIVFYAQDGTGSKADTGLPSTFQGKVSGGVGVGEFLGEGASSFGIGCTIPSGRVRLNAAGARVL